MLFDNPIFEGWYTDSMMIYRNEDVTVGSINKKQRVLVKENIPCRVYSSKRNGPQMGKNAATAGGTEKVSCDLNVDIKPGDELFIIRGGALGMKNEPERYFSGKPQPYYDPVGGVLSGLEHQEVALLMDEIIG